MAEAFGIAIFARVSRVSGTVKPTQRKVENTALSWKSKCTDLWHGTTCNRSAVINQADDTPHEWGQGAVGFGRRFASAFGKHIVHKSIQYPLAKAFHEQF